MASKYVLTKETVVEVSAAAATAISEASTATFVGISCVGNEFSYNDGQPTEVDVATFCSTEQESDDGLAAAAEITIAGNFVPTDEGLLSLKDSKKTGTLRLLRLTFRDGSIFTYLVQVRQNSFTGQVSNKWTTSITMRVKDLLEVPAGS
ncbi:hypothetical protein ACEK07_04375 [Alcanivoracaceae bacterium MT1]